MPTSASAPVRLNTLTITPNTHYSTTHESHRPPLRMLLSTSPEAVGVPEAEAEAATSCSWTCFGDVTGEDFASLLDAAASPSRRCFSPVTHNSAFSGVLALM